jgi:hypothetical protein
MIKLEYIGEKPVITHEGIGFKGKKDKYEYIEPAAHILKMLLALRGEKAVDRIAPNSRFKIDEILKIFYEANPQFDKLHYEKITQYEKKLNAEEQEVQQKNQLSDIEKSTLRNNLIYMRRYRIQRATNKLVYEEMINRAVEIIKEKQVHSVKVPFSITFLHVLDSLDTTMKRFKAPPKTSLEIKMDEATPYANLSIEFFKPLGS